MVDALNIVDGIGLGRPLCQEPYEPYLCSHISSRAHSLRTALPMLGKIILHVFDEAIWKMPPGGIGGNPFACFNITPGEDSP